MRLVASIARRYRGLGLPAEDVEQEGVVGLLEAIDRYDPSNGASFPTYAYWRIRQAICHALTDRGRLLRVPKEVVERRRLIARSPLAEATGLSPAQVAEALLAPTTVASLDAETGGGTPLRDVLSEPSQSDPLDETVRSDEVRAVDRAVLRLPSRERAVIEAHFGFGREPETLATVGRRLGLSETRVRALERRALRELATDLEPEIHRS